MPSSPVVDTNEHVVNGTVVDAKTGDAIPGINIIVAAFASEYTDENGAFEISVPDYGVTLIVTGQGYAPKEVSLRGREAVSIALHTAEFSSSFGNVNMILGEQSQTSVTSAISTIQGDISSMSKTTSDFISGKASGMRTISRSGTPGIGANMFIRGYSSLFASAQPLIVIDGLILETEAFSNSIIEGYRYDPLSDINPKDIANITVIKDATSLYGSKAANGVIIIETTKATETTTRVDFSAQGGINLAPSSLPMMESSDYKNYLVNQLNSSGMSANDVAALPYLNSNPDFYEYNRYNNNTNWQDEVFDNSYSQDYLFRVTGGDEIAKYGLSIGFNNNEGVISNTASQRLSTRFNSSSQVTKRFSISTQFAVGYQTNDVSDDGLVARSSPLYASLLKSPLLIPTVTGDNNIVTNIYEDVDVITGMSNPSVLTEVVDNQNLNYKLFGGFNLGYDISDNLKLKTLLGINYVYNRDDIFFPMTGVSSGTNEYGDVLVRSAETRIERFFAFQNDTRLSYTKQFGQSNFAVHVGARYNTNNYENSYSSSSNQDDDEYNSFEFGKSATFVTGGSIGSWKYASLYSNIHYGLKNKYFVDLNMSYEGSSRFGSNNQYGYFPSLGAAWVVSSEDFMKDLTVIDQLKLRASYGFTGNDNVGNYNSQSYFVSTRFLESSGLVSGNLANTNMQWERTKKANIGADLALFNERVQVTADFYSNKTDQMLNSTSVNPIYGFSNYLSNDGEMTNKGYELGLNLRVVESKSFQWDMGGNVSHYTNEITSLPGGPYIASIYGTEGTIINQEGSALGLFYGYKTDGIYNSTSEAVADGHTYEDYQGNSHAFVAGDVKFIDKSGDGVIGEDDLQVIGDPNPNFTGMFYNTFTYKNLSLSALFTFSQGGDIYNALRQNTESMSTFGNQSNAVVNRWQVENQQTDVPRAEYGDPTGNARFSDRWVEDGSYIRLKTLSLTYSPSILSTFVNDISFSLTANNLFTFTDYLGYDPEVSMSGVSYNQGVDAGFTPQFTSVLLGVKIGL